MDAVCAVITLSAHPAVDRATQHKFKAASDTWCSHRQHLNKAGGMDFLMLLNKLTLQKQGKATEQCNYAKVSLLKKQRCNSERGQDSTDYEQLQGEVTTSIQV